MMMRVLYVQIVFASILLTNSSNDTNLCTVAITNPAGSLFSDGCEAKDFFNEVRAAIEIYRLYSRNHTSRIGKCRIQLFEEIDLDPFLDVLRDPKISHVITIGSSRWRSALPFIVSKQTQTPLVEILPITIPALSSAFSDSYFEPFAQQDYMTKFIIQEVKTRGLKEVTILTSSESLLNILSPSLLSISLQLFGGENVRVVPLFASLQDYFDDLATGCSYWESTKLTASDVSSQGLFVFMSNPYYVISLCEWIKRKNINFDVILILDPPFNLDNIYTDACDFVIHTFDLFMNIESKYDYTDDVGYPFRPSENDNRTSIRIFSDLMRAKGVEVNPGISPKIIGTLYAIEASMISFQGGMCPDMVECFHQVKTPSLAGFITFDDIKRQSNIHKDIFHAQYRFDRSEQRPTAKIFYPPDHATHTLIYPIPTWDDRECFDEGCPECYDNVCPFISTMMIYMFGIFFAVVFVGTFLLYISSDHTFSHLLGDTAYVTYAILEIVAGAFTLYSIHALRPSANNRQPIVTSIIIIWCIADISNGAFKLLTHTIFIAFEFKLNGEAQFTIELIFLFINALGIFVLFRDLSMSTTQMQTQMPTVLDLILNTSECALVLFGEKLKQNLDVTEILNQVDEFMDNSFFSLRSLSFETESDSSSDDKLNFNLSQSKESTTASQSTEST